VDVVFPIPEPSGFEATGVSEIELEWIKGEKLISFDSKQNWKCLGGGCHKGSNAQP
jgi:hypothetical protein